jgi:hypothetical protein
MYLPRSGFAEVVLDFNEFEITQRRGRTRTSPPFLSSRTFLPPRSFSMLDSKKFQIAIGTPRIPPSSTQRSYVPCSLLTVSGWPDGRAPNKHTSCAHTCVHTHTYTHATCMRTYIRIRITHTQRADGWTYGWDEGGKRS